MPYCRNCGIKIAEGTELCPNCKVNTTEILMTSDVLLPERRQEPVYPSHKLRGGLLTWSVINTVLAVLLCSVAVIPLSVLAIVFTCNARAAFSVEMEDEQVRIARTLNVIATVLNVFYLAIVVLFWVALLCLTVGAVLAFAVALFLLFPRFLPV